MHLKKLRGRIAIGAAAVLTAGSLTGCSFGNAVNDTLQKYLGDNTVDEDTESLEVAGTDLNGEEVDLTEMITVGQLEAPQLFGDTTAATVWSALADGEEAETKTLIRSAQIHSEPKEDSTIFGTASSGQTMTCYGLSANGMWYKVSYNGRVCYIELAAIESTGTTTGVLINGYSDSSSTTDSTDTKKSSDSTNRNTDGSVTPLPDNTNTDGGNPDSDEGNDKKQDDGQDGGGSSQDGENQGDGSGEQGGQGGSNGTDGGSSTDSGSSSTDSGSSGTDSGSSGTDSGSGTSTTAGLTE